MKPTDEAYKAAETAILEAIAARNCAIAGVPFNKNNYTEFDVSEAISHAVLAVDAAYAAQFQSEEYAGLIDGLREWAGQYEGITLAGEKIIGQAADAIETVLAERDDFAEQLALRSESCMAKDMQEIMRINNELKAERDALLARLAPVDEEALVDIAIKEVERVIASANDSETVGDARWKALRAAIAVIRPHIEAAERERCAKIAEGFLSNRDWVPGSLWGNIRNEIAAAIRSGK